MIFAPSNIKDFLYKPGKYFLIPEFQRPYSWDAQNISAYLDDIEQMAKASAEKKHYFGSVVFVNDAKDLNAEVIIDGQQRLTTSLLMLMALYHIIETFPGKCAISVDEVRDKYLFNSASYAAEDNRIRLKTITSDDKIFNKLFHKDELDANERQSKLYLAYTQFYDYLSARDNLESYINTLAKFDIVTISLNAADDNPQRVFESINSTGQPLTDGDKIRNFALMLNSADEQAYVYEKYWQKIEQPLTQIEKDNITDFFRAYIIARRGAIIPAGNVYPEFKKLFNQQIEHSQPREQIDAFYGDILQHLEYYRLAKMGTDPNERYASLADFFFKMRYVQIEAHIPFALNVLHYAKENKISISDLREIFTVVETYFSRRIVCNIATTGTEKVFASLHRDILEHQKTSPNASYVEIMKFILLSRGGRLRLPRDTDIAFAIANNQTYFQRKAHVNYLLASIDDKSKESSVLKQINSKELRLSIEHVMPQTLTDNWIEMLGSEYQKIHEKYLHGLANLTLTGYNSEYSNLPFTGAPEKDKKTLIDKHGQKVGFDYSPLIINKWISQRDKWAEDELKARQEWWRAELIKVWPEPASDYKPIEIDTKISLLDDIDLTNTSVRVLYLQEDQIPVTTWAQVLDLFVERIFDLYEDIYDQKILYDDFAVRYIRRDQSMFINPEQVNDSEFYIETGTPTNYKRQLIARLAKMVDWSREDIAVELAEPLKAG